MTKQTKQQPKAERYAKLEDTPVWRVAKILIIGIIIIVSLIGTVGLWSSVNDCYVQEQAHRQYNPSSTGWDSIQQPGCDTVRTTQTAGLLTMLITPLGIIAYKSFRYTSAYIAFGKAKSRI